MFGSKKIAKLELENAEMKLMLDRLNQAIDFLEAKLADVAETAITEEKLDERLEDILEKIDLSDAVEGAVESVLDRATISIRY